MCGIAGLFGGAGELPWGTEVVDAMCRAIVHRGPDDPGIHATGFAHIGMRRLAIIDLHSGHQPIHNEDRSVWTVFNGEIYNFAALRRELEALGHRFYTNTDTECIVHGYEQWGDALFEHLRGMFAIAIVDLRRRRLVLGRDRLGKKPLYYTVTPDGVLAFASELKCLFAVPGFAPQVCTAATRDYFALGYVPAPASIYEGVYKLPPAHVLIAEGGRTETKRYWTLDFGPKWTDDPQLLEERLIGELEDAVRARLVSDVPFGAFLSGGTDSSVVAALMARNLSRPLQTFSIGFQEAAFNELPDARRVAQHLGAEHHELVVQADAVSLLDDLVWHFDEPFGDSSAVPTFLVSKLAAGHVKMVLSGDGGDEVFAGYERYSRYRRLRRMRERSFGLAGPALSLGGALIRGETGGRLQRIGERLVQTYPDDYLSGVALATAQDLSRILALDSHWFDPFASVRHHFTGRFDGDAFERILAGDMATYLSDDILVKVDRMAMAHSLEARAPLLDHRLIEFAARLPLDTKLGKGGGKLLLKRVARRLIPAEWVDKPKQGFAIPLADWMRSSLKERLLDTLGSASFRQRGLFALAGVDAVVREHMAGQRDHGEMLWLLLTYETWARRFLDGAASKPTRPLARSAEVPA